MPQIVIGLVGKIASGKDSVKKHLEENYPAESYRFSSILREVLATLHLEANRGNIQKLSSGLRQVFGEDLLAKTMAEKIKKAEENENLKIIILDGIRRPADIIFIRNQKNFFLIGIEASPEIRYQRVISRNENSGDREKTYEEFLQEDNNESEKNIQGMIDQADFLLDNNSDFDSLFKQLEKIIGTIKEKGDIWK